ncbi:MAG: hypothetical protein ACOYN0_08130 [Phycisphaerales bacterium]
MSRRTVILVLICSCSQAWGVGPSIQRTGAVNAVVQMRAGDDPLGVTATGSVVAKRIDSAGMGWLCVLTADHVAGAGFTGIGFGDGDPPPLTFAADDSLTFRAPFGGADLAVIGVPYGSPDGFFESLEPLSLAPSDPGSLIGTQFSQIGYGWTGVPIEGGLGLATQPRAGVKGFQNNVVERVRPFGGVFTPYAYTALEWDFNQPGASGAVVGEGSSFNGDSGSPYLIGSPTAVTLESGAVMEHFTIGIAAVHTYGDSSREHGWVGSGDHIPGGGVAITPGVAEWIGARCAEVPAPGSLAVVLVLGLAARRRR